MRVILWSYFEDAEEIMTKGALATRSNVVAADLDVNEKQIRKMLFYTKKMKLSSVLDFAYYVFSIEGVSRSFTHQWVRYRIAAHMQQSLRYVKIAPDSTDWFVIPPSIVKNGVEAVVNYIKNQLKAGQMYLELIKKGVPLEDARFALPIGVKTHISSAFDAEEMIHIIYQRTCFDAQWEIRAVAYAMLLAGLIVHPRIFEGVGPPCVYEWEKVCRGAGNWKCFEDAKGIINDIRELASNFRSKFLSLAKGQTLRIDLTDVVGYRAPPDVVRSVEKELGMPVNLDFNVILEIRKR